MKTVRCKGCGSPISPHPHRLRSNPERCCATCHRGRWKSRRAHAEGYVEVKTGTRRWELEHRVVMAKALGRALAKGEVVHHRNGIRTDNRIENLVLCESAGKHVRDHHPQRHGPWLGKTFSAEHRRHISEGVRLAMAVSGRKHKPSDAVPER